MAAKIRIPLAFAALAVWIAIMFWGAWLPHETASLAEGVTSSISTSIVAASVFLAILVVAMRWWDIGFNAPRPWNSLRVLIGPAVYLVLFFIGTLLVGWPAPHTVLILAVNTLLVGFSEETMFRGVLFRGLRSGIPFWPAVWLTSVIFGSVHVLNATGTGDLIAAVTQAVTAFMAGTFFLALVLRTRSIVPAILFHACWDFLLVTIASSMPDPGPIEPSLTSLLLPLLLDIPLFIYAIVLLRGIARQESENGSSAATTTA